MFKSAAFYICAGGAFLLGLGLSVINGLSDQAWQIDWCPLIIKAMKTAPIFISVFVSMFLGVEYSDSIVKNKLIIGLERSDIYASNYIAAVCGSVLITIAEVLPSLVWGLLSFSQTGFPEKEFWSAALLCFFTLIAYSSLISFFSMFCNKKAITVAVSVLVTFICFFSSKAINKIVTDESDYYNDVKPWLIGIDKVLPFGTIERAAENYMDYKYFFKSEPFYAFSTIVISSGVGMLVFRRRDLK